MFFPPKRKTIIAVFVAIATMATSTQAMAWQSSEFERRAAAMARARARSSQPIVVQASAAEAVKAKKVSHTTSQAVTKANITPAPTERVVSSVVSAPRSVDSNQKPARVAQLIHGGAPISGGSGVRSNIVGSTYGGGEIISGETLSLIHI